MCTFHLSYISDTLSVVVRSCSTNAEVAFYGLSGNDCNKNVQIAAYGKVEICSCDTSYCNSGEQIRISIMMLVAMASSLCLINVMKLCK